MPDDFSRLQRAGVLRQLSAWLFGFLTFIVASPIGAQEKVAVSFGTGFVVTDLGHVVTAYHVIRDKAQILVGPLANNRWAVAQIVKVDEQKDLALLKTRLDRPALPLAEWHDVPIGLEAAVVGYPQPRMMGLSKKITTGIVNGDHAESGDKGYFQFSAEVQKGNSGGPVLAPDGSVIGVVLAKLNALSVAEKTRDLPQNVNYALKSASLKQFLEATGFTVQSHSPDLTVPPRSFLIFRKVEASIVAVVARSSPKARKASADRPDDEVDP